MYCIILYCIVLYYILYIAPLYPHLYPIKSPLRGLIPIVTPSAGASTESWAQSHPPTSWDPKEGAANWCHEGTVKMLMGNIWEDH